METKLKSISKMDIYSDMRIPFDIGTWLRGHKFNVTSVAITKKLQECDSISAQIRALEDAQSQAEGELGFLIEEAKLKMTTEDKQKAKVM